MIDTIEISYYTSPMAMGKRTRNRRCGSRQQTCRPPQAAHSHAGAAGFNRPAVHFDDGFDDPEADTQTGLTIVVGHADLNETIEDAIEHLRGNPNAVVANGHDGHC